MTAVRIVAAGDALLAPAVTRRVIEAFAARPEPARRPAGLDDLTPRELEVLALVARGWTNAELARDLVIAETTVKSHLANILLKLGARDRVQVVIAAYEGGVIEPGSGRAAPLTPRRRASRPPGRWARPPGG